MANVGSWIVRIGLTIFFVRLPWLEESYFQHEIYDFLGRLHPLVLHFPIVLIVLAVIFELWFGKYKNWRLQQLISITFKLGLYTSILTVLVGYLLYANGDYGGEATNNHLLGGCALGISLIWADFFRTHYLKQRQYNYRKWFRILLISALILVIYTGHYGGMITHGADFVVDPLTQWKFRRDLGQTAAAISPGSMKIFEDMIIPGLQTKCINCHNEQKTKGGLDLSSYEQMLQGGKSGDPMLVAGQPRASALYQRISLPPDHDDFMPPKGKAPLDEVVTDLISWWIDKGGEPDDTLGKGPDDPALQSKIEAYLPTLAMQQHLAAQARTARKKIEPKLRRICYDLGLDVEPDLKSDSAYFVLSMRIPPQIITDESLSELMPYRHVFSRVSLVSADITDDGLYYLGQMSNLKELILTKTCIKGGGLVYLKNVPKLELLNLSHTDVNNEHILEILSLPKLKQVFLFNAEVDENVRTALDENLEQTAVTFEEGPYY